MIDKCRSITELHELVSLYDSSDVTTIHHDTIELLYSVKNTAIHGDLDFLIESDNSSARAACEALDSLLQDIRDNW